jgi:hypothetical protein
MAPRWLAHRFALLTVVQALFPGCAWFFGRPKNEGSTSAEGVRVMVVQQACLVNEDPTRTDNWEEIVLMMRVRNATTAPVNLNPGAIRLGLPDRIPMAPTAIDEDAPRHAPAGASESFELRFRTTDCCPDDNLLLQVQGTVSIERRPITFEPIVFGAPCEGADTTSY